MNRDDSWSALNSVHKFAFPIHQFWQLQIIQSWLLKVAFHRPGWATHSSTFNDSEFCNPQARLHIEVVQSTREGNVFRLPTREGEAGGYFPPSTLAAGLTGVPELHIGIVDIKIRLTILYCLTQTEISASRTTLGNPRCTPCNPRISDCNFLFVTFLLLACGWQARGGSRISQRGRQPLRGAPTHNLPIFPENCMIQKKFWPGGRTSLTPPRSTLFHCLRNSFSLLSSM